MTEYNILKDYCSRCHKIQFCVELFDKRGKCQSLCEICLGWVVNYPARIKDQIRQELDEIMVEQGIEDLEPIHDIRDLD